MSELDAVLRDIYGERPVAPEDRAFAASIMQRLRYGNVDGLAIGDVVLKGKWNGRYLEGGRVIVVTSLVGRTAEALDSGRPTTFTPRNVFPIDQEHQKYQVGSYASARRWFPVESPLGNRLNKRSHERYLVTRMEGAAQRKAAAEVKRTTVRAAKVAADAIGTCQGCLRESSLVKRAVARHGWIERGRRVGFYGLGRQRGRCVGSGYAPLEVDAAISRQVVAGILREMPLVDEEIAMLRQQPALTIPLRPTVRTERMERSTRPDGVDERGRPIRYYVLRAERDGGEYRAEHAYLMGKAESHLAALRRDLDTMRAAILQHGHAL